jgi:hypothetical protein
MVVQDLNVNPIVQGGDVFVIGDIRGTGQSGYPWWASEQCDIDFGNNPWNETIMLVGIANGMVQTGTYSGSTTIPLRTDLKRH